MNHLYVASNFWEHHGILFLMFITLFPRLTLFFSSVPFGGLFWWLGFIFAPRILVAWLATVAYGRTNPFLVAMSWIVALSGESGEKYFVRRRIHVVRHRSDSPTKADLSRSKESVIDADFRRVDD